MVDLLFRKLTYCFNCILRWIEAYAVHKISQIISIFQSYHLWWEKQKGFWSSAGLCRNKKWSGNDDLIGSGNRGWLTQLSLLRHNRVEYFTGISPSMRAREVPGVNAPNLWPSLVTPSYSKLFKMASLSLKPFLIHHFWFLCSEREKENSKHHFTCINNDLEKVWMQTFRNVLKFQWRKCL